MQLIEQFLSLPGIDGDSERLASVHDVRDKVESQLTYLEDIYLALVAADDEQDFIDVIEQAEQFLSATSYEQAERRQEVIDRYSAAFVRWFARVEAPLQAEEEERVEAFRRLVYPGAAALRASAPMLVTTGGTLAVDGQIEEALANYTRLKNTIRISTSLPISGTVYAGTAAFGVTERLSPLPVRMRCARPMPIASANIRDSHGVSRAQTGDYEGAIDDFSAFIDWASNRDGYADLVTRIQWVAHWNRTKIHLRKNHSEV